MFVNHGNRTKKKKKPIMCIDSGVFWIFLGGGGGHFLKIFVHICNDSSVFFLDSERCVLVLIIRVPRKCFL